MDRMTAVATGPGMGTGDGAAATLEWILDTWNGACCSTPTPSISSRAGPNASLDENSPRC